MTRNAEQWQDWEATIAPAAGPGTFAIYWTKAPAMERLGGYSGPYKTRADATADAIAWADYWHVADLKLTQADTRPEPARQ